LVDLFPSCIIIYIPLSTIYRSSVVQYRFCTTHDDALCLFLDLVIYAYGRSHIPLTIPSVTVGPFSALSSTPSPRLFLWLYPFIFFPFFAKQSLTLDDKRVPVGSHPFIYLRIYTYHHFSSSSLSASRTNKSCCFVDASCCGVDVSFIVRSFFFSASSLTTPCCCCCFDAKMYYSIYIPFFCCSHFISAIFLFSLTHSSLILSRSCFINLHFVTCTLLIIICFCFLDRFYFFSQISHLAFFTYLHVACSRLLLSPSPKSINAIFLVFPYSSLCHA